MKYYKANFNYSDVIDTPNKAYWLGFLFADGYIAKRIRKTNAGSECIEYNLKFSVKDGDDEILIKLAKDLESNYPIHYYDVKSSLGDLREARLFITNKYMVEKLYNEYGIVPNRTSIQKIVEHLKKYPKILINNTNNSIPNIVNISLMDIKPETFVHALEKHEVYVSSNTACASGKISNAVLGIYNDKVRALTTIRISLSYLTTNEEIEEFLNIFDEVYEKLEELRNV